MYKNSIVQKWKQTKFGRHKRRVTTSDFERYFLCASSFYIPHVNFVFSMKPMGRQAALFLENEPLSCREECHFLTSGLENIHTRRSL